MFLRSSPERDSKRPGLGLTTLGLAILLVAVSPEAHGQEPQPAVGPGEALELPPDPPHVHLGFIPGEDRRVADWGQVTRYLEALAAGSHRVQVDTIGRSTLDRPMLLVTISDPANLRRLDELREIQSRLADPRRIRDREEREALIRDGRLVVLITAAIHPTEVGSTLAPLTIAYRLASASDPEMLAVLRETVILIVPSLNPDGVDLVADWYRNSLDMPWEGEPPPFLYHHYAGHDNNRDWYAFTQIETVNVVERVHNRWHPQIVHDIHQQEQRASRFFVPPWLDPIEPNVDPLLIGATNALGTAIAWEMQRLGKTGVTIQAGYEAWAPARAYSHYHAGVRILSETASARLASPVDLHRDEVRGTRWPGADRTWNQPSPWPGGRWTVADILDYMETGAMALLRTAARERETWLRNFLAVGERAVSKWPEWPIAWIIPGGQENEAGVAELTRILHTARVEIQTASEKLQVGRHTYPTGTLFVDMRQPYAAFVQAMLAPRAYPGGPLRKPYDATAHNLPLLLNVRVLPIDERPEGELEVLEAPLSVPAPRVRGLSAEPGVFVGLYRPWVPSADEGWTRWLFDRYEVPYATLHDREIRQGDLNRRFTAIVIPSLAPDFLEDGWPPGAMPVEYTGGLGADGMAALHAFARDGGTLIGLGESASLLIERLRLPVTDRLRGQPEEEFFATGAQVGVDVDTTTVVGRGLPVRIAAWIAGGGAFDLPAESEAERVASYGADVEVLSGWVHGADLLSAGAAVVDIPVGLGRVVLFGIRPQYRGQTLATYPLLFNSLRSRSPIPAVR